MLTEKVQGQGGVRHSMKIGMNHLVEFAVHGELVGGSLALMLALTECRVWDKARVVGASVTEPVVDWLFEVDEYMQNKKNLSNESHGESIEEHQEDVSTKQPVTGAHTRHALGQ